MWGMGEIASISGGGYAARAKQVLSVLLVMSPVDQAPCLSSVMIGASAGHYGGIGDELLQNSNHKHIACF